MTHAVPRTTGALVVGQSGFVLPTSFLENQVSDPLSHAMIVGHVIVTRPRLEETRQSLSLRFGHQKHQGVSSATLIVQRLHALSVARDVFEVSSQPILQRIGRPVGVQIQGKTVKHLARIPLRPYAQPMLARLSGGIRVDDVALGTGDVGIGGKTVARDRTVKRGCQRGVVKGQLIQLTRRQDDFFHFLVSFFLLASTVVDVVEDGLVAVHFQQVFEFSVDDDGHVDGGIRTEMKHQLQLSAQFGVQHGTVQMTVGHVVKCKQGEGASVSPFLSCHHVSFTLSQTACGFQEAVIAPHVQLSWVNSKVSYGYSSPFTNCLMLVSPNF